MRNAPETFLVPARTIFVAKMVACISSHRSPPCPRRRAGPHATMAELDFMVNDPVKNFVFDLHDASRRSRIQADIDKLYGETWAELTKKVRKGSTATTSYPIARMGRRRPTHAPYVDENPLIAAAVQPQPLRTRPLQSFHLPSPSMQPSPPPLPPVLPASPPPHHTTPRPQTPSTTRRRATSGRRRRPFRLSAAAMRTFFASIRRWHSATSSSLASHAARTGWRLGTTMSCSSTS